MKVYVLQQVDVNLLLVLIAFVSLDREHNQLVDVDLRMYGIYVC